MAAPFVSAAAAYIKLALPNASVAQVKSILENYAVDYGAVGKDDYYGYGVINLADLRLSLSGNATLTLKEAAMTFTGTACTPGILVSGIASGQYTVSYANNTRPGTGTVTITGKGLYTGSLSASFKIQLATPGTPTVANVANGIKVQWKSVAGAGGYVLYRKKGSGAWTRIKSLGSGLPAIRTPVCLRERPISIGCRRFPAA
jgi:hypothetical protein